MKVFLSKLYQFFESKVWFVNLKELYEKLLEVNEVEF